MNARLSARRRQGFSLVELAVVIVIVGVLAAFGVPRYRDSVERTKAAEAFNYLSAVRAAQERHQALHGKYATDVTKLDIQQEPPKYFEFAQAGNYPDVMVTGDELGEPFWYLQLDRDEDSSSYGYYNVVFSQRGFSEAAQGGVPGSNIPAAINPVATGP